MSGELRNHTALITGAGRGIGRATALRLASAGCNLALLARTERELEDVAAAAIDVRTWVLPADVTDDAQVTSALHRLAAQAGPISILINNAGSAPPRTPVAKASPTDWDRILATCLRAPMILSRLLLPAMLAQQHGAIINVASVAGRTPRPGEAVYAAAKAGLIAFTQALFAEVRNSGIKVAAICPGFVDTALVPPNRRVDRTNFLRPQDVAEAIFQVLITDPRACATTLVLEPQFDPEKG